MEFFNIFDHFLEYCRYSEVESTKLIEITNLGTHVSSMSFSVSFFYV